MQSLKFSIIIPVYNRPEEVKELLDSLSRQTDKDFEVLIMEGDSQQKSDIICKNYAREIDIHYHYQPKMSRSGRRNLGMEKAIGNYFLFFDSDCIIPDNYIRQIKSILSRKYADCFGGPDNAEQNFSNIQRAINYSMTSIMTTGGVRGRTKKSNKFCPRTFNMGISKEVFLKVGGFREIIGEDIDMSLRIKDAGFAVHLIREVYVFHKRKINLKKFFKQVYTFGKARILLSRLHHNSLEFVHILPTAFLLGNLLLIILSILLSPYFMLPIGFYVFVIFVESLVKNKSLAIASLSTITSYIQLCGYGLGFLDELFTGRASKVEQELLYKS